MNAIRNRITTFAAALCAAVCLAGTAGAESAPSGEYILAKMDEGRNLKASDLSATMTMVREDPESGVEKDVIKQFRRDAKDQFVFLFLDPAVKKGQGYLRVEDNLWFYDPESRKFSHSSMKDHFANSDARNSDFGVSTLADDYRVSSVTDAALGKYACWILDLDARGPEVTYAKKRVWISKDRYLLLKTEDESETGRLLRTSYYPSYAAIGDRNIATKAIFIDGLVAGRKTTMTFAEISVSPIPDQVFTKAYIERVNN